MVPATVRNQMSVAQRRLIVSLREQIDGVSPGTYSESEVREMSSFDANIEIDHLKVILGKKKTYPCALCGKRPCAKGATCPK